MHREHWSGLFLGLLVCGSAGAGEFHCAPAPLGRIPPGTKVAAQPPAGWTHLIFKAQPQLATGDLDKIPEMARPLSQFLLNVMLARVEKGDGGYVLGEVAVGLATRVGQDDMVIDSASQESLGADLGIAKQVVLTRAEEQLGQFQRVAQSPSAWLVETTALMALDGANRPIVLRYLILVDAPSGKLATFVWRIDRDNQGTWLGAQGDAVLIQPGLVGTSPLHVDGSRFIAGIPRADAIAITRLPRGAPFEMPDALRGLAGQSRLTPLAAGQLSTAFARSLGFSDP